VALSTAPLSGIAAEPATGRVACGAPFLAVNRVDSSDPPRGLGRLGGTDAGATPASRRALLHLAELQRDVDWYRACHRPAVVSLVMASGLTTAGIVLLGAWAVIRRQRRLADS
jgi:hypothetical protein